ncbi:hypothetical protein GCM10025876_00320 [Demequina litorisediminis]|uniref:Alanyl-transfer RNA synthetases family profile domain-containing protein n=1 Tax=Demequina litorisediminis TaxID=1849022 RepID=A0ABQ6IAP7_9MICO|nr:hypothetical protein GCM10025876_00320 [Demequina litorisediminis]
MVTSLALTTSVAAVIKDGVAVPVATAGDTVEVILAETPFYAESGGQDADTGEIRGANATLHVIDVQKPVADVIVHTVTVTEGEVAAGDQVSAEVDRVNRHQASKAHSATHLIHAALHETLGTDANQAGSYNKPGYMRLDFSWRNPVTAMAREEIEGIANRAIREELPVSTNVMNLDEAKNLGAMALFGEKYGDRVRVVEIGGPFSRELCAGTHVANSSQIGLLTVTSEGSVGSGARRIEALVGADAFSHLAAERSIVAEPHKHAEGASRGAERPHRRTAHAPVRRGEATRPVPPAGDAAGGGPTGGDRNRGQRGAGWWRTSRRPRPTETTCARS